MDLKEYILPKNSMMGGWYIPSHLCDELVKIFKDHPKNQSPGVVADSWTYQSPTTPSFKKIDPDQKESTEVGIDPKYNDSSFMAYRKYLEEVIHKYEHKYPEVEDLSKFGMVESCQIQHYKPGQGFKMWHFERGGIGVENRCLVFMTYLNDVPDGGTHFKYQELTTPAEKGLTLIWPTDFTHTHKGQITKQHEKYIITGWMGFI